jgi:glutamate/tyrosine decarboxylase-like PLP-dependent enzyme
MADGLTGNGLDGTRDGREKLGRDALAWVLDWFSTVGERRLYPDISASSLERHFSGSLPLDPEQPGAILAEFAAHVAANSRDNGHPRMFGYVQSSGTFVGAVGDFLASALNANVTSWRSSPAATTIERQVIGWIKALVGFSPRGDGLLVSGGSMANLVGIVTAVTAAHPDVASRGVRSMPGDPVLYASSLVHMSIPKAAAIAGLGRHAVRTLPVDAEFRLDVAALDRAIEEDRRGGCIPVCVVVNVGDVNTGAIDPVEAVADVCRRHRVWLHADGAYGGFARLAPSAAGALSGLGLVDSISLDPHKWLFVPVDSGCILVRDAAALGRAFRYAAEYVDVIATPEMSEYAFWDYGPELTRRFRALKIWMALKAYGVRALSAAIERNITLARRLAALIDESDDFERLAPVPLSIVCFRYVGSARSGERASEDELNDLNRTLMLRVQHGGRSYLSNAAIDGRFALRACIVNHRTVEADLVALLDEIRRSASAT